MKRTFIFSAEKTRLPGNSAMNSKRYLTPMTTPLTDGFFDVRRPCRKSQQEIQSPAPLNVRLVGPAMIQNIRRLTASLFQHVGKYWHPVKSRIFVNEPNELLDGYFLAEVPKVERPERVAEY